MDIMHGKIHDPLTLVFFFCLNMKNVFELLKIMEYKCYYWAKMCFFAQECNYEKKQ